MKKTYIVVDLTDVIDPNEVIAIFAEAKCKVGEPITSAEFRSACDYFELVGQWETELDYAVKNFNKLVDEVTAKSLKLSDQLFDYLDEISKPKKPNIFKRAWNWIKSKFKK